MDEYQDPAPDRALWDVLIGRNGFSPSHTIDSAVHSLAHVNLSSNVKKDRFSTMCPPTQEYSCGTLPFMLGYTLKFGNVAWLVAQSSKELPAPSVLLGLRLGRPWSEVAGLSDDARHDYLYDALDAGHNRHGLEHTLATALDEKIRFAHESPLGQQVKALVGKEMEKLLLPNVAQNSYGFFVSNAPLPECYQNHFQGHRLYDLHAGVVLANGIREVLASNSQQG